MLSGLRDLPDDDDHDHDDHDDDGHQNDITIRGALSLDAHKRSIVEKEDDGHIMHSTPTKYRWPPVTTYATLRTGRSTAASTAHMFPSSSATTTTSSSTRAPSGWVRQRSPSAAVLPRNNHNDIVRPPELKAVDSTKQLTSTEGPIAIEQKVESAEDSTAVLWTKIQAGLAAAIEDVHRRRQVSGDLFNAAHAQEKHTLSLRSQNDAFTFRQYAPLVFRSLRKRFNVTEEDYLKGLCGDVQELGFRGKSGSFLYVSSDNSLVIKTISVAESKFLRKILLSYYEHVTHPTERSFLVRFLGMYRINATTKASILVMLNAFGKAARIDERYDLKGSTLGRKTLFSCTLDKSVSDLMLKDLDLVDRFRIKLGRERKAKFMHIITYDAEVPKQSLLLGVHFIDATEEHKRPRGLLRADFLHSDHDGIWSSNDKREPLSAVYYCAIIDILQPYNVRKQLEHNLKGMVHDKQAISVCPPTKYVSRFLHFIGTYIE